MTPTMIKSKFVLFCYWNKFKKPIILAKLDMTEYNLDINTTNFIMETAHQKKTWWTSKIIFFDFLQFNVTY